MNSLSPAPEEVRAHYRTLAESYIARENKACKEAYRALAARHLSGCGRILEVGCGASGLRGAVPGARFFGCDLSHAMLCAGTARAVCVADGCHLPVAAATFDGAVCINVLEHGAAPTALLSEMARVLKPQGRLLAVTPNGAMARVLDWLERLRLKLPEGPHRFLTPADLAAAVPPAFTITRHETLLACPAGPPVFVRTIDRVAARWGLFQVLAARRA